MCALLEKEQACTNFGMVCICVSLEIEQACSILRKVYIRFQEIKQACSFFRLSLSSASM